ncbi:hypothetical protein EV356DRAFT_383446 [Viridothelium virens]|uniref:Small ribosomal subunit protein mS41 n=1 Tax=Viridothelium virens TaxID=1048519 RepID=A0A6A6HIN9_VIRVR|nr:hypothetical protein EV356DRAFT_383446 [Viridothelium virens]
MQPLRPPFPISNIPTTLPLKRHFVPFLCTRCLHSGTPRRSIPEPTPFCPDPSTFLTLIGRQLSQHASKIPTWEALFSLSSPQLRELGVEPARSRRYLLRWREKFRNGEFGVGGDFQHVQDGVGELRIVEVPDAAAGSNAVEEEGGVRAVATANRSPGMRKVVVNVKPGAEIESAEEFKETVAPSMIQMMGGHTISGPHVELVKGTEGNVARVAVKEGLWEQKRGHKVDGGERRKAEVRAKRRSQERKDAR